MVLCRLEAVTVLKQLMGDPSVHMARATRPGSLRARFGRDGQRNALHGSESLKVPSGRERKWVIECFSRELFHSGLAIYYMFFFSIITIET